MSREKKRLQLTSSSSALLTALHCSQSHANSLFVSRQHRGLLLKRLLRGILFVFLSWLVGPSWFLQRLFFFFFSVFWISSLWLVYLIHRWSCLRFEWVIHYIGKWVINSDHWRINLKNELSIKWFHVTHLWMTSHHLRNTCLLFSFLHRQMDIYLKYEMLFLISRYFIYLFKMYPFKAALSSAPPSWGASFLYRGAPLLNMCALKGRWAFI